MDSLKRSPENRDHLHADNKSFMQLSALVLSYRVHMWFTSDIGVAVGA